MALCYRGGKIYCYHTIRRDGRVTGEYLGSGPVAILMEREVVRQRAVRRATIEARRQDVRARIASVQEMERAVSQANRSVDEWFRQAMMACGYYLHKREWRRKKMSMQVPLPGSQAFEDALAAERARRLFDEAGADTDALIERFGGRLAKRVQERLVAKLSNDPFVQEGVRREAESLRQELSGKQPTVIERLIVERIIVAWLNVAWADLLNCAAVGDFEEPEVSRHCARLLNSANRLYLSSLRSLALIRRAMPVITSKQKEPRVSPRQ